MGLLKDRSGMIGSWLQRAASDPLNIKAKSGRLDIRTCIFSNRVVKNWNEIPYKIKKMPEQSSTSKYQEFSTKYESGYRSGFNSRLYFKFFCQSYIFSTLTFFGNYKKSMTLQFLIYSIFNTIVYDCYF
jgi:hypothetical protein